MKTKQPSVHTAAPFLFALSLLLSSGAHAGPGSEAHGGSTVVCFDSNPTRKSPTGDSLVDAKGNLTAKGVGHITSAVTLEFFLASLRGPLNPKFAALQNSSYEQVLQGVAALFHELSGLYTTLRDTRKTMGEVAKIGIPSPNGVGVVGDTGVLPNLPEQCALIQTVMRRADTFYFDARIWGKLSGFQQALLQLHEELYYIAVKENEEQTRLAHTYDRTPVAPVVTSEPTQLFLSYMIGENYTDKELLTKAWKSGGLEFPAGRYSETMLVGNQLLAWYDDDKRAFDRYFEQFCNPSDETDPAWGSGSPAYLAAEKAFRHYEPLFAAHPDAASALQFHLGGFADPTAVFQCESMEMIDHEYFNPWSKEKIADYLNWIQ